MGSGFDVLIAGGGPAGAVAAHVLARAGRLTMLVDDARPGRRRVGESLPGAARPLLRDLGLLGVLERGPHLQSAGNLSAWGSDELVATDFIRDPHGPGWHLDRARFDADLRAAAREAGAELRAARVRSAVPSAAGWSVELSGGRVVAAWLIDATGRRAAVARGQGARRRRDDRLVALCAWASADDADTRTLMEATADGWWYTALVPGGARVAALHVDADTAATLRGAPDAWPARLGRTTHVSARLSGSRWLSPVTGQEACGARLDRFTGPGWLAVGDAALSFDPLSSQGIFTALYTGMNGARAVDAALSGSADALDAYTADVERVRAAYLRHHHAYYRVERRWPHEPFWAKRHVVGH